MSPVNHVIISGGVTAVLSLWVRSWGALWACFLSGILIDVDHYLDYFIHRKAIPGYRKLVDFLRHDHRSRIFLFLHSYEILALIWLSVFLFDLSPVWLGIAIGSTVHVFCDEIVNPIKPMAYFLSYRFKNKFDRKCFLKKCVHE